MTRPVLTPLDGVGIIGRAEIVNDTVAVPLSAGWVAPTVGDVLRAWHIGPALFIAGGARRTSGSLATLGTLPAGYRPTIAGVGLAPREDSNISILTIGTDGTITTSIPGNNLNFYVSVVLLG